jgi:hypothetical protein
MRCEETRPLLEEYLDGELAPVERDAVAAHVERCAECATESAALEREHAIYATYDRGFEPDANAAWAAIMRQVDAEAPRPVVAARMGLLARLGEWLTVPRLLPFAAVAAAVVVAVTVGFWPSETKQSDVAVVTPNESAPPVVPPVVESPTEKVMKLPNDDTSRLVDEPRPLRPKPRVIRPAAPERAVEAALPEPVVTAERQYLDAIAVLVKDVERGNESLDPALRQDLKKPFEEIDRNIAAARRAVEQSPDDPTAVLGMLSAYDAKVDTLQQLARFQVARDR